MREEKSRIRQILRERKAAVSPADRQEKSQRICRHVMGRIKKNETVLAYTSKEMEVNTTPLIDSLLRQGNPVVVPIIQKGGYQSPALLPPGTVMSRSRIMPGVPEPIGSEIPAGSKTNHHYPASHARLWPVGARIGYGAGYYDRFLEKNPGLIKIGIAFACQEIDKLPLDDNDIRMDCIITEDRVRIRKVGGIG
ncbi:MAG: 5-formyltetrahydrofolate cyclo-ligase [Marinilabiliales bacterium]|nr:5-formyltetrahydrofolate cyclo-ligase [Marinilabiliales bacterium]